MKRLLLLALLQPSLSIGCLPNEVHIREQWIPEFKKADGTKVRAHLRSEHCRELNANSYTQNSSSKAFRHFQGKFKSWSSSEKTMLNVALENLPLWLKQYKSSIFLRATSHDGNPSNPALTYPDSKTIILFDAYFSSTRKREILLHELSHIAVWDVDPKELQNFFISNGWEFKKGESPRPPAKVIIPDSSNSPSEDFANTVETYYSNPQVLKAFNSKSFSILEAIIKTKEKQ